MKTNMKDIDELIKETLTEEEAKFYDDLKEPGFFGSIKELFTGKNSWLIIAMNIMQALAFGLSLYCLIKTFDTEDTNDLLLYVAGFFLGFLTMSMIKMYSWMQIDKNNFARELKRLELQISSLASKISD